MSWASPEGWGFSLLAGSTLIDARDHSISDIAGFTIVLGAYEDPDGGW